MTNEKPTYELPGDENDEIPLRQGLLLLQFFDVVRENINARSDRMEQAGNANEARADVVRTAMEHIAENFAMQVIEQTNGTMIPTLTHFMEIAFQIGYRAGQVGVEFEPIVLRDCGPDCECRKGRSERTLISNLMEMLGPNAVVIDATGLFGDGSNSTEEEDGPTHGE